MCKRTNPVCFVFTISVLLSVCNYADIQSDFADPPLKYKPRPLWFWNYCTVTPDGINEQMQNFRDLDGYGGFGILPFGDGFGPEYLSDEYFDVYGTAIQKAAQLGMNLNLYDEYGFPSGSAGALHADGIPRFQKAYPDDTIKRLDKHEYDIEGPATFETTLPAGAVMSVVAMNMDSKEIVDLSLVGSMTENSVSWEAPSGNWKIMIFVCVTDGDPNVDYLSPDSVSKFISMTHREYYNRFSDYFGRDNVINATFNDEPTMYRAAGRMWTPDFNDQFTVRHGFTPTKLYPALWYDIGTDTQAARNLMFGMRTELYAKGFYKTIQEWCDSHGDIMAMGHQDKEETVNPCNVSGDLIKVFKYLDVPGIDFIKNHSMANSFYKVVSAAADNYDKPYVMSESYGAMDCSWDDIYFVAMNQYTKGINMLIPHAVWYDTGAVKYKPELSYRTSTYASGLPAYNRYMGRLNRMLQNDGRHVADIAVLYPIAAMQGANYLDGPLGYLLGGVAIPEADYHDVGTILSEQVCRDFTFLHPEVLDEKCTLDGSTINLNNMVNYEKYKVFIIPAHTTISWSNLSKIKQFYDNGGKVIATQQLPYKSAELGHDADVVDAITYMFPNVVPGGLVYHASSSWAAGGYDPVNAFDGSMSTRWNAADGASGAPWLEIDFGKDETFNKTIVKEAFNRIIAYEIQYFDGNAWVNCASGTTIGSSRTDMFAAVTASKIRLYINTISSKSASICEFEVYLDDGPNLANSITNENSNGGKSYFVSSANEANLRSMLDDALTVYDVEFENDARIRYIHKVKDNVDIYFFANLSGQPVDTYARIRGKIIPQLWNPHDGAIVNADDYSYITQDGKTVTRVRIALDNIESCFVVCDCVSPEFDVSGLSGTPDCIVDLYDLADFFENWLSCGLYPESF
jgi:hypothetical protein